MPKATTISELRTFIEAVEFASEQEDAWVPNARQWSRIRDMIFSIEEAVSPPPPVQMMRPVYQELTNSWIPAPVEQVPMQTMPLPVSSIAPRHPPVTPPVFANPRTPDIDTSNGQYTSPFA